MKDGFHDRLETELQGQMNTYYVGGLMAFELTERNSSYAMALVCKHFGSSDPLPRFPYTKVLETVRSPNIKSLLIILNTSVIMVLSLYF